MNRKRNRKGFTIVELVIVIAVIAILATTLVPTFGNVISNAQDAAAKQEAKNAYTSYMIEHVAEGQIAEYMVYDAGGRFVALHNGAAVGVYENKEAALAVMASDADPVKLVPVGNLWVYEGIPMTPEDTTDAKYTMVAIPDTQTLLDKHPEKYYALNQWIVDNKKALNIQAVMHMGDMTQDSTADEWIICKEGTDKLDAAGIPWMPMMGNHDNAGKFNSTYAYSVYSDKSWFGGSYDGETLNHTYWFVTNGSREYMILSLGWAPSWDVLNWAKNIIEDYPNKSVIINCHAYMNKDGTFLDGSDAGRVSSYSGLSNYPDGDDVWEAFSAYENVVLTLSGHIHNADVVYRTDKNGGNRDVYSLLLDRQDHDGNGSGQPYGMIALLTFYGDSDKVDVAWYSTVNDKVCQELSINVPQLCQHTDIVSAKPATCTEPGGTQYTCTKCGRTFLDKQSEALAHQWTNKEIISPTATQPGYTSATCTKCGKEASVNLTSHFTWTLGTVSATTGAHATNDQNWVKSNYVNISDYDTLYIRSADTTVKSTTLGIAFYDKDKKYICGLIHTDPNTKVYGILDRNITVPKNAVYICTLWFSSSNTNYKESFGDFYCIADCLDYAPATGG